MLEVELVDTGERFGCRENETLLAGMERLGRRGIPVGCRGGGCGVCKVRVLDGSYRALKMSAEHIGDADRARNIVLACRAIPTGPVRLRVEGRMRKYLLTHRPDNAVRYGQEKI